MSNYICKSLDDIQEFWLVEPDRYCVHVLPVGLFVIVMV